MPYKDKQKYQEYNKERMRVARERVAQNKTESESVQPDMVPASYIQGNNGRYQFLPERPRYLTLSDGQVLDRKYTPAHKYHPFMAACNDAWGAVLGKGLSAEERLSLLAKST